MNKLSIFSFFSGSGLLDLGFETEGFDISYINEYHKPFIDAYIFSRSNMKIDEPEFGYSSENILEFSSTKNISFLKSAIKTKKSTGSLVGFIGGPPCPDFSVGGKNKGQHGINGKLSGIYVEMIIKHKPDFFLFENVKGLWKTKKHREFYDSLKNQLHKSGYATTEKLINSIEYGVPQDRERIILIGIKKDITCLNGTNSIINFPWDIGVKYDKDVLFNLNWPTRNDFIEDSILKKPHDIPLELTVEHWFKKNNVLNHFNSNHCFQPRAGLAKFQIIDEGDDLKKSYKRLHRWRYSPTACYGNNEVHLHPYKARRISVAEALAIQSMPQNFILPENMSLTNMFKTVGNGVPFLAAKGIAMSLKNYLNIYIEGKNECNSVKYRDLDKSTPQRSSLQLY